MKDKMTTLKQNQKIYGLILKGEPIINILFYPNALENVNKLFRSISTCNQSK